MSQQWTAGWTNFDPQWTDYTQTQTSAEATPLPNGGLVRQFPNPFNPTTTIVYTVPKTGRVSLIVYNVRGQKVATLLDGEKAAGTYEIHFNAKGLSSGTYFYSFSGDGFKETRKMVLLR